MFSVYILKSIINNRFYIGQTKDIKRRLTKHNKGLVRSTKAYKPWKIVYFENYKTLSDARKRENQIKSWKKRSLIEKLIMSPSSIGRTLPSQGNKASSTLAGGTNCR